MLSKETLRLCIKELEDRYNLANRWANRSEVTMALIGTELYKYEHALFELKEELKTIEENN